MKVPSTPANRLLRRHGIRYTEHLYRYVEHGGTAEAAAQLGFDERLLLKTLIFEVDGSMAITVLMPGAFEVSTKRLARTISAKRVEICSPPAAEKRTGYRVGGTSPFGLRHPTPVYLDRNALGWPEVYVNGGARGYLLKMKLQDLQEMLKPAIVDVALDKD